MDINQTLVRLYNEGKSRKQAMAACKLRPSQISGISHRLNLYWSMPPEKRKKAAEPAPALASPARGPAPAQDRTPSAAPDPGHSAQAAPALQGAEVDKAQSPGRFKPSPGFVSARKMRIRGYCKYQLPEGFESMSEEERYLHKKYSEQ